MKYCPSDDWLFLIESCRYLFDFPIGQHILKVSTITTSSAFEDHIAVDNLMSCHIWKSRTNIVRKGIICFQQFPHRQTAQASACIVSDPTFQPKSSNGFRTRPRKILSLSWYIPMRASRQNTDAGKGKVNRPFSCVLSGVWSAGDANILLVCACH